MSVSLGSLPILANKAASFQAPSDGVKAILIGNESGLTVTVTMESGGVQKTLYPSLLDWFEVRRGFTGTIKITPTVILNNVANFPSSSLIFDAIGLNDPEDASMYPISLTRTTNNGNVVSTVGGTATAIQNDNNVAGTSIIEATVKSDGSSAVKLTNDAVFTLGDTLHNGSLAVFGASSLDNGNITTDGVGDVTIGGLLNVASTINAGRVALSTAGGLTAISKFGPFTVGTTGTAFSHGLGATPDIVLCVIQGTAGGSGALHNVKVDNSSYTSTQFTAIADAASVSFIGIAIKF